MLARVIRDVLHYKRASVVYSDDATYGSLLHDAFLATAQETGLEVCTSQSFGQDTHTMEHQVDAVVERGCRVVVMLCKGSDAQTLFLEFARRPGWGPWSGVVWVVTAAVLSYLRNSFIEVGHPHRTHQQTMAVRNGRTDGQTRPRTGRPVNGQFFISPPLPASQPPRLSHFCCEPDVCTCMWTHTRQIEAAILETTALVARTDPDRHGVDSCTQSNSVMQGIFSIELQVDTAESRGFRRDWAMQQSTWCDNTTDSDGNFLHKSDSDSDPSTAIECGGVTTAMFAEPPPVFGLFGYDAVLAAAVAFDQLQRSGNDARSVSSERLNTELHSNVSFAGLTGHVTFRPNGDRASGMTYAVYNSKATSANGTGTGAIIEWEQLGTHTGTAGSWMPLNTSPTFSTCDGHRPVPECDEGAFLDTNSQPPVCVPCPGDSWTAHIGAISKSSCNVCSPEATERCGGGVPGRWGTSERGSCVLESGTARRLCKCSLLYRGSTDCEVAVLFWLFWVALPVSVVWLIAWWCHSRLMHREKRQVETERDNTLLELHCKEVCRRAWMGRVYLAGFRSRAFRSLYA